MDITSVFLYKNFLQLTPHCYETKKHVFIRGSQKAIPTAVENPG